MSDKIIQLESLTKQYKGKWGKPTKAAVSDVSLSIEAGEAFGFIGPNGAGKSTTIKILTGAVFPTSGRAFLNGLPVTDPASRKGVGFVPESPVLYDYLTPYEILEAGLTVFGVKVAQRKQHIMQWLDRFSLAEVASKKLRGFSKGMQQRTALAYALAIQPHLLILDEPLSGLDPVGRKDVVDILMAYKKEGGTLFFSSHVLHDVERLADRFGLINKGVLKTIQAPSDLLGETRLFTVKTQGVSAVAGMSAESAGKWIGEVGQAALWPLLSTLEQAGHVLLEVRPSLTLEAAFMAYIKE